MLLSRCRQSSFRTIMTEYRLVSTEGGRNGGTSVTVVCCNIDFTYALIDDFHHVYRPVAQW